MTDTSVHVVAASDVSTDQHKLDHSIRQFAGKNSDYYVDAFKVEYEAEHIVPRTFNRASTLLGPIWAGYRGVWGMFWAGLLLEVLSWVQIGRGLWGDLGANERAAVERQLARAEKFLQDAQAARAASEDPTRFETLADNMRQAAERSQETANAAAEGATTILLAGIFMLFLVKLWQGVYANRLYERQYSAWRIAPDTVENGIRFYNLALALTLVILVMPLTVVHFTLPGFIDALGVVPPGAIDEFPANKTIYSWFSTAIEDRIDLAAASGGDMFDSIVSIIRWVLDAMTAALVDTPWPVVMLLIFVFSWRSAGPRVAIFSAAALAYLAFLGFWEVAMETVALVGAAVIICLVFGIPLGIWFGKSRYAYRVAEPILDLMQTLPAFVYLIPIIAFFGTGNPPGILATIIFGMPPVIRLTALGVRTVPESIKEGAEAFGASRLQLLKDVEVPLAMPSIAAGVNQTILMCLSMVVVISLIGGGGLGKKILEALQYAAKGPGLLAGFAILFCAIVIDRTVRGALGNEKR